MPSLITSSKQHKRKKTYAIHRQRFSKLIWGKLIEECIELLSRPIWRKNFHVTNADGFVINHISSYKITVVTTDERPVTRFCLRIFFSLDSFRVKQDLETPTDHIYQRPRLKVTSCHLSVMQHWILLFTWTPRFVLDLETFSSSRS